MKLRFFVLLFLLTNLLACTGLVNTQVSAFRALDVPLQGSVFVLPKSQAQAKSLEFAFYQERLAAKLAGLGYSVTKDKVSADLLAMLDFDVEEVEVDDKRIPSAYFSHGYRGGAGRHGVLIVDDGKEVQYLRTVKLTLAKNDEESEHVYETTGQSIGRCAVLAVVFDEMMDALLKRFPADNASVKNITVRGDTRCR